MFDQVNLVIFLLLLDRQFYVDQRKSPGNHNDVQQSSVIYPDDVDLNTMVDQKSKCNQLTTYLLTLCRYHLTALIQVHDTIVYKLKTKDLPGKMESNFGT